MTQARKIFSKILSASSLVLGFLMTFYYFYPVFATPPTSPYAPGETSNPSCAPGDTNCTVYPPLTTTLTTSTSITMGSSSLNFDSGTFFIDAENGRMGIGTTTPSLLFSVNGDVGLFSQGNLRLYEAVSNGTNYIALVATSALGSNTTYYLPGEGSSGQALTTDGNGNLYWGTMGSGDVGSGTAGQIPYYAADGTTIGGTSTLFITVDRNVGINSTSPVARLSVQGTVGNENPIFDVASSTGTSLLRVLANGNVGINSSSPVARLSVVADTESIATFGSSTAPIIWKIDNSGNFLAETDGIGNIGASTANRPNLISAKTTVKAGSVTMTWDGSSGGMSLSSNDQYTLATGNEAVVSSRDLSFYIDSDNNQTIARFKVSANNREAGGNERILFTIDEMARVAINSSTATSSMLNIVGTSTYPLFLALTSSSVESFRITDTGDVGINSSTPMARLSVQGTEGNINPLFDVASSTGDSLLRVLASGRVAINTTTASAQLDIQGSGSEIFSLRKSGGTQVWKVDSNGHIHATAGQYINFGATNYLLSGGAGVFDFRGAAFTAATGKIETGFVAIGTTTFSSALTVSGTVGVYESGVNAFTINSSGDVGINSSTPMARLSVQGTEGNGNPLFDVASSTGASLLRILSNGNVGIGNSNPGALLVAQTGTNELIGFADTLGNNPGLFISDTSGNLDRVLVRDSNNDIFIGDVDDNDGDLFMRAGGSTILTLTYGGSVGIGTTTPTATLTVQGSGITSSTKTFETFTNAGTSTFSINDAGDISMGDDGFYYEASSTISYINAIETGAMSFDDDSGIVSWINLPVTTNTANIIQSYSAQIDDNDILTIYAETDGGGGVHKMNVGINTSTPIASLSIQGTPTSSAILDIASSTAASVLRITPAGNIGIGTTTPRDKLQITGNVRLETSAPILKFWETDAASNEKLWEFYSQSGQFRLGARQDDEAADNQAFIIDRTGSTIDSQTWYTGAGGYFVFNTGNVGIGTSTPAAKLQILGTTEQMRLGYDVSNYTSLIVASDGSLNVSSTNRVGIGTSSPVALFAIQPLIATSSPFFDVSSSTGSSMLRVLANGDVGIGTSTPAAGTAGYRVLDIVNSSGAALAFHVASGRNFEIMSDTGGDLRFRSLSFSNTDLIDIRTDSANSYNINLGAYGYSAAPYDRAVVNLRRTSTNNKIGILNAINSFGDSVFFVHNTGTVGINTSSPGAVLSITGTSTFPYLNIISSSSGQIFYIDNLGRVGIGTSTPTGKLAIQGTGITSSTVSFQTFTAAGTSTFKINDAGDVSFGNDGFYYEASSSVSYVNSLETGGLNFDDNAGMVTWVDMQITDSSMTGTSHSYTASIDDNPMLMIYADSDGMGGITNQTISINTSTTSTYKLYIDAGASTTAALAVEGYVRATGYVTPSTTLDLAETYPLDPRCSSEGNCPEIGDVVCATQDASSTYFIQKCADPYSEKAVGIVSENPGFILGGYDLNDTLKMQNAALYPSAYKAVALAGRVPVKVSTKNGPINLGDNLTASDEPGVAVKALEPGRVIGVALQSFSGDLTQTGTVKVFVNPHWSVGSSVILSESEESLMPDFTQVVLDKFTLAVKNSLRKLGLLVQNGIASVKELFAEKVKTNQLCVGGTCINEQQLQDILNKTQTQPAEVIIESPVEEPAPVIIESPPTTTVSDPVPTDTTTTTPVIPADVVIPSEAPADEGSSSTTPDVTIPSEPVIIDETATSTI